MNQWKKWKAAIELSSHATILKVGGVKAGQNTVSDTPFGNHRCRVDHFVRITTSVSISATLLGVIR